MSYPLFLYELHYVHSPVVAGLTPRAQMMAKKMTVRKIRKEVRPSSADQEAPNVNQVWVVLLELVLSTGKL
jgi:hypothetical protein